jgi:hypothetical protein
MELNTENRALNDEELDAVAGGTWWNDVLESLARGDLFNALNGLGNPPAPPPSSSWL